MTQARAANTNAIWHHPTVLRYIQKYWLPHRVYWPRLASAVLLLGLLAAPFSATAEGPRLIRFTVKPEKEDAILRFRGTSQGHLQVRITKRLLHLEARRHGRTYALAARKGFRRPRNTAVEARILALKSSVFIQLVDTKRRRTLAHLDAVIPEGTPRIAASGPAMLITRKHGCEKSLAKPNTRLWFWGDTSDIGFQRIGTHQGRIRYSAFLLDVYRAACHGTRVERPTASPAWRWKDTSYRTTPTKLKPLAELSKAVKHPDTVNALLETWHRKYPNQTRLEQIGKSHSRRPVMAMAISNGPQSSWSTKRAVLLNGAHHGNEPISVDFVLDTAQRLLRSLAASDGFADGILNDTVVWIVPVVNPDGLHRFLEVSSHLGRKNGREHGPVPGPDRIDGVDLNRNYPFKWGSLGNRGSKPWKSSVYYRGPKAASEPEVRAIMALAARERFDWSLTYHSGTVALLYCYTINGTKSPVPNPHEITAERLISGLPDHPQGKVWSIRSNLYPVDGTDQDWHYHTHGTLALLVEGARHTPVKPTARRRLLDAVWPLAERMLQGDNLPVGLTLRFENTDGPISNVEVTVDGLTVAGERWTPRERDGRLHLWLPRAGDTTFHVHRQGSVLSTINIDVPASGAVRTLVVDNEGARFAPEGSE